MALKVRKNHAPPPPEGCELNPCLSVIAGAWTPHVIWHLRAGPRRFGELRVDIPQVSPKVLTTRLRQLEARGVLRRLERPTSPPSVEYELTDLGAMLVPALEAIVEVSRALDGHKKQPHVDRGAPQGAQERVGAIAPA